MDYQNDVRLAVRDELPTEIDSSDVAENLYAYMFMTEMTWPSLFFGAWAAFEPDVCIYFPIMFESLNFFFYIANYPLSMGERCLVTNVQR